MKLAVSKALNYFYLGAGRYRAALADFFFRKTTIVFLSIGVLFNAITWFLAITLTSTLKDNLAILHYNVIFGIDRIGLPINIYVLPVSGLAILALNFFLGAGMLRKNEVIPSQQLVVTGVIANLVLLVSIYLIYSINFS